MYIYEVNVHTDSSIIPDYAAFIREYAPKVKDLGKFQGIDVFATDDGFVVHFIAPDDETIQTYLEQHAHWVRAKTEETFSGKYRYEYRILRRLDVKNMKL